MKPFCFMLEAPCLRPLLLSGPQRGGLAQGFRTSKQGDAMVLPLFQPEGQWAKSFLESSCQLGGVLIGILLVLLVLSVCPGSSFGVTISSFQMALSKDFGTCYIISHGPGICGELR